MFGYIVTKPEGKFIYFGEIDNKSALVESDPSRYEIVYSKMPEGIYKWDFINSKWILDVDKINEEIILQNKRLAYQKLKECEDICCCYNEEKILMDEGIIASISIPKPFFLNILLYKKQLRGIIDNNTVSPDWPEKPTN